MCCPVLKAPKLQPVSKFQHFLAVCQLSGLKYIDAEMQTLDVRTNGFGNFYKKKYDKNFLPAAQNFRRQQLGVAAEISLP
jgi:hypothetical protein